MKVIFWMYFLYGQCIGYSKFSVHEGQFVIIIAIRKAFSVVFWMYFFEAIPWKPRFRAPAPNITCWYLEEVEPEASIHLAGV